MKHNNQITKKHINPVAEAERQELPHKTQKNEDDNFSAPEQSQVYMDG